MTNHEGKPMSSNDILDRAKDALEGITEGPWGTDGELIASELTQPARGVTEYKHGIASMNTDDYDEEDGPGEYDGEVYRPHEQMLADANFIAQARELVPELIAEVERLQRAAKTLGKIIEDTLTDVKNATESQDLIGEDGDGDWMAVFERLAELRPARDAARAEVDRLKAQIEALRV